MIFQLLLLGKLKITKFLKKNIYKTNNIQKVSKPLMAGYIEILKTVFGVFDSIYFLNFYNYTLSYLIELIKDLSQKKSTFADDY